MSFWSEKTLRSFKTMQALATLLSHAPKLADETLLKMSHILFVRNNEIKQELNCMLLPAD